MAQPISARDREIGEAVGRELVKDGIVFAGLDVIGDWLTEVNVTSPTCIVEIAQQTGQNAAKDLLDALKRDRANGRMTLHRFRAAFAAFLMALSFAAPAQDLFAYADLEARLRLSPSQKEQFNVARAATQRALFSIGLIAMEMKGRLSAELAKDRPDFDALVGDPETLLAFVRPHFRDARAEWAKLYATMSDEQLAIAREYGERQLSSLERAAVDILGAMREKLRK